MDVRESRLVLLLSLLLSLSCLVVVFVFVLSYFCFCLVSFFFSSRCPVVFLFKSLLSCLHISMTGTCLYRFERCVDHPGDCCCRQRKRDVHSRRSRRWFLYRQPTSGRRTGDRCCHLHDASSHFHQFRVGVVCFPEILRVSDVLVYLSSPLSFSLRICSLVFGLSGR